MLLQIWARRLYKGKETGRLERMTLGMLVQGATQSTQAALHVSEAGLRESQPSSLSVSQKNSPS